MAQRGAALAVHRSRFRGSFRHTVDDLEGTERTLTVKIRLTSLYVDDQEKALSFYTDVLGFVKKADVSQGGYRWLTVASPEEPDGTELQLALNGNPAAKAYQQAMFQQGERAAIFHTGDLQGEFERLTALGVTFTAPIAKESWGSMAILDDSCGNLIQLTQPGW
jgi:predicted enzyme related to lactoylglutathione lyase